MSWTSPYIGDLVRQRNFPLRAARLFYCNGSCFRSNGEPHISRFFEVSLRLGSSASLCEDQINGISMKIPFPNTVFKRIGSKLLLAGEKPRDTISLELNNLDEIFAAIAKISPIIRRIAVVVSPTVAKAESISKKRTSEKPMFTALVINCSTSIRICLTP